MLIGASGWTPSEGQFLGSVVAQWIDAEGDHHKMRLLNDFGFTDFKGKTWQVPKGVLIDDSSIPKALWVQVGSPLTGPYREAVVLHNYYCNYKKEPWFLVHRMFYEACLTAGLPEVKAKLLFAGVFATSQRWLPVYGKSGISATTLTFQGYQLSNVSISEVEFKEAEEWIEMKNPSLDEIVIRLHCLIKAKKEKRLFKPNDLNNAVSSN
ncbi:DUF1353 domain-containing protein [Spirosoma endbachense]|nr:DUF1353 domain-containing protein [Spirosoma endbachense]